MAKTIKVGSTITLAHDGSRNPALSSSYVQETWTHFLTQDEVKVRVLQIAFPRPSGGNRLWLRVMSVKSPVKQGWIRFDAGGFADGLRLRIQSVTLLPKE